MNVFVLTIHNPEISLGPTARLNGFLKSKEFQHHVQIAQPPFAFHKKHTKFDTFVLLLKTIASIFKNRKKTDLIHVVTPPSYPGLIAVLAKKLFKIPYIVDIGDPCAENIATIKNLAADGFVFKTLKKIDNTLYKNADHLILTSDGLQKYIPENSRHTTILTGVTEENQHKELNTSKKCIYLGQYGPLQNFEYILQVFIKAIKEDDEISLDVYGQGETQECKNLISQQGISGLEHKINFFDPVPSEEIPKITANYSLGIVSLKLDENLNYAIPTKALSYLSLGLPVFGTGGESIKNLIENSSTGSISSKYNTEEDSKKLIEILNSPETLKIQSENAFKFAKENLTFDRSGHSILEIYNFCLH